MEDYKPSAAAQLIESRRLARGVSVRKVSTAAELSEGRWRQIAKGYQQAARGVRVPVNAPPETLARMAATVGIAPEDMDSAGHSDVADLLRDMGSTPDTAPPSSLAAVSDEDLVREIARRFARTNPKAGEGHARSAANPHAEVSSAPDESFPAELPTVDLDPLLPRPEGLDGPAPGRAPRKSGHA